MVSYILRRYRVMPPQAKETNPVRFDNWRKSVLKTICRVLILLLVLALLCLLVPSATPVAIGEALPVYTPVELEAEDVIPLAIDEESPVPDEKNYLADNAGYTDSTISVRVETTTAYNTLIYLCWIRIADASQIRTELCNPYPSKKTAGADVIARRVNAVVAMNSDNFMHRKAGYVVRGGELLRNRPDATMDTLLIDDEGNFHVIQANENAKKNTKTDRIEAEIAQYDGHVITALSFGPALVIDGEMNTSYQFGECAPKKRAQRLAIAQMGELSYLMVATHGPDNGNSTGLTMKEFARLLTDLGAQTAYNLDGGSSATIVLNGKKINSRVAPRPVGDILYFATAER